MNIGIRAVSSALCCLTLVAALSVQTVRASENAIVPGEIPVPEQLPQVDCQAPTPVSATCCQPIEYCAAGVYGQSCGVCGHHGHTKWCHIHTTGDLYPHFPYYPEHHGYYYFRPYNYSNVLSQQQEIVALGGDPLNPHGVRFLDSLLAEFAERYPAPVESYEKIPAQRHSLPELESFLTKE